jgi:hypothetical protein
MNHHIYLPVSQHGKQFRLTRQIVPNKCFSRESPDHFSLFDDRQVHSKLIPRNNRPAESHFVDSKEKDLPVSILFRKRKKGENTRSLSHRLEKQDTRHNRPAREVTLKKGLVDRHVFDSHDPLLRFHFQNPIHEKKWVSMGKQLDDLLDIDEWCCVSLFQSYPPTP